MTLQKGGSLRHEVYLFYLVVDKVIDQHAGDVTWDSWGKSGHDWGVTDWQKESSCTPFQDECPPVVLGSNAA